MDESEDISTRVDTEEKPEGITVRTNAGKIVAFGTVTKPAIKMPQCAGGVDLGVERRGVLFYKHARVFWVPGHTGWLCRGSSTYYPGHISVTGTVNEDGRMDFLGERFSIKGVSRLSQILKHPDFAKWVSEKLELPIEVVGHLRQGHTVKITKLP